MQGNWYEEFGAAYDVPREIEALDEIMPDTSWRNDACPSFQISIDNSVRLWVDHPDARKREGATGTRFTVTLYGCWPSNALETDSLDEVLRYLRDHWGF